MAENFLHLIKMQGILGDRRGWQQALAAGKSVQLILGLSDEALATLYRLARGLLEQNRNEEAANAFLVLVLINPHNYDFWLGLGMATQLCEDFEGALDAYEMAAMTELNNPIAYLYLAKCFFALHEQDNALIALDLAIEYAGDLPAYMALRHQAQAARALLLKQAG